MIGRKMPKKQVWISEKVTEELEAKKWERRNHALASSQLIKATRRKHGLTQTALANLLGVPEKTLNKWERDGMPWNGWASKEALRKLQEIYQQKGQEGAYELDENSGRIFSVKTGKYIRNSE